MTVDIKAANREAVERLCRARPAWTGMTTGREALGLGDRTLLHAGPPIGWERMCPIMRGAVTCAIQLEGWAATPADAERLAASGEIGFAPCHSRGAVAPMAGIISPGMPLLVVEDRANATRAWSFMGTGPGPQLRFGAHAPEALARLGDRWFPARASVVAGSYFPGFTAADANRDVGDSAIMETYGLGGMAMAASPAVTRIVGAKSVIEAIETTRRMAEICVGRNPGLPIGTLDWEGTPTGIDVRKVVAAGIVPSIN